MSTEPTTAEKLRGLRWGVAFYAANAFSIQLSFLGSVFILFLDELGLSKSQIGSLMSLLPFASIIAPLVAPAVARFGYKRTVLTFWSSRAIVTGFLVLVPWTLNRFGANIALTYIAAIIAVFALSRSFALTALFPWTQEYVPPSVRGKYSAMNNIFSGLSGFLAVTGAGYIIGNASGLGRFTVLFALSVIFGLIAVTMASFIPGGASARDTQTQKAPYRQLLSVIRDKNFVTYLAGISLMTIVTSPIVSFVPLFMQEQVGLSSGNVVWLQTGILMGGLLSSYIWGWAADRYGSTPVTLSGVYLYMLLPISWLLMPRETNWSLYIALGIALLQGMATIGWSIGSSRLLFVSVVPPEKRNSYMSLYYMWFGIVGGLGQVISGWLVDASAGLSGHLFLFSIDPYTPLFIAAFILPLLGSLLLQRVRTDSAISAGEFAGMFFRGNPLLAVESLIRFRRAKDERATVSTTELLGQSQSPLTVDELLEALDDHRFNVRFEAIVSIARREADTRLSQALTNILHGNEPALSVIAAWALGRIGDEHAIDTLRKGLNARYRSVQAHCARSLGTLQDQQIAPLLLERLQRETDRGLQIAYASALGKLQTAAAIDPMLALLLESKSRSSRREVALAIARVVGEEYYFIQLSRQSDEEIGTATALALSDLKKKITISEPEQSELLGLINKTAEALARQELELGADHLVDVIHHWPTAECSQASTRILQECALRLEEFGPQRIEYLLLTLHTMAVGE